jgi:hypothetical protein
MCYGVGKKMKKEKEERTRKKNLASYATDVALLFFVPTSHFSRLHIYIYIFIYEQNFKTNVTFVNSNHISLTNNVFMRTKEKVQV